MAVRLKRAYQEPSRADGYRVLVERLWPRGVRREELRLDAWARDLAPSDALRRWYGHDPARFPEFARRYTRELHAGPGAAALADLVGRTGRGAVTLVFAARDAEHSNAAVLRDLIEDALRSHA